MSQPFSTVSHSQLDLNGLSAQILAVGDALRAKQWTLTTAESCTGGGIAYALTSVAGSSDWFKQGWVTYANEAKQHLVNVSKDSLTAYGAVSAQVVTEMAIGAAHNAGAQCAVAVSGVAGPGGGSEAKPVGTVWFGFTINGNSDALVKQFAGDRAAVRNQSIEFAVSTLHQRLVAV
ncbi:nicotinamide-nucleotide amidohydrolase family protein [Alteromonas gilva]|uniref:Nicotinamide-nucleotide amidohydrolase family protein n=1 Tax=Alteromonas gilva TaxID=2987522 RepID=A0ABT5L9B1_9ALTE|nr:nicotinamide-nucleotide amidohydrolase family protein [Alteromonas gilva]MDC8832657.1 nicotinamide-nucleotide amidohydrolase family protein [Alteromonas gilva]